MALSTRSHPRPSIGVTRVRQGRLGRNVLWVLLITLLLVVLGFFATWTWRAPDLARVEPNNATERADVQDFAAPQPAGAVRQNYATGGVFAPQNSGNPGQPNRSEPPRP
ncbi:hypothetical protein LJR225_003638 [Phenylobacterium sp. LjRoot225]|uniref:hypothetical protein n=1 Tax=Phenylobacterium sp. LjRoot225 TaxID=3342285 RepID=UPI003ECD845C